MRAKKYSLYISKTKFWSVFENWPYILVETIRLLGVPMAWLVATQVKWVQLAPMHCIECSAHVKFSFTGWPLSTWNQGKRLAVHICNHIWYKIAIFPTDLIISCFPEMNSFHTQVIQDLSTKNSQSSSRLNYKGFLQAKRNCGISLTSHLRFVSAKILQQDLNWDPWVVFHEE